MNVSEVQHRYHTIVDALELRGDVFGLRVTDHRVLWALTVCAAHLETEEQVSNLILGNLNPIHTLALPLAGMPSFPDAYCVEEQLRFHKIRKKEKKEGARDEPIELGDLLDDRIGTSCSYSIVLAIALRATGKITEKVCLSATAVDNPEMPDHVWLGLADGSRYDLLRRALGADPLPNLRESRRIRI